MGIPLLYAIIGLALYSAIMIANSLFENKNNNLKAIYFDKGLFKSSKIFNIISIFVIAAVSTTYFFLVNMVNKYSVI